MLGQTALLHFTHAAELRHVLAVNTLRAIVSATRFTLFASDTLVSVFGSDGFIRRIDLWTGGGIWVVRVNIVLLGIVVRAGERSTEKDGG